MAKSRGNGEGSIYFLDSKKLWCAQYKIGVNDSGKPKRKTLYGKTRKEVKEKLEKLISDVKTDKYVERSDVSLSEIGSYIIEDKHSLNIISDITYIRNKATLKHIEDSNIGKISIQKITPHDIKLYLSSLTKYSDSVISKEIGFLNAIFKRAVYTNVLSFNPLDNKEQFKKPKSEKEFKKICAFTIDEQKEFCNIIFNNDVKYKTQYMISLFCGLRMGEVNALTLDNINSKENKLIIENTVTKDINESPIIGKGTKTYSGQRIVPIPDKILLLLNDYISNNYLTNDKKLIFLDNNGRIITTSQVNIAFKRLCQSRQVGKGYDVNLHMLRHTFATRCIESGMPATVLQKILGHKDVTMTLNVYTDVFAEYERLHHDNSIDYLKNIGINL